MVLLGAPPGLQQDRCDRYRIFLEQAHYASSSINLRLADVRGVSIMDVNGLACGIEFYLGSDCLSGADGQLTPVQWRGYDAKLRRYQGELLAKREVLERFRAKLAASESNPSCLGQFDWSGVELIIDTLRSAFHAEDKRAHLEYEEWAADV